MRKGVVRAAPCFVETGPSEHLQSAVARHCRSLHRESGRKFAPLLWDNTRFLRCAPQIHSAVACDVKDPAACKRLFEVRFPACIPIAASRHALSSVQSKHPPLIAPVRTHFCWDASWWTKDLPGGATHVDIVVNAAGVNRDGLLLRAKPEEMQEVVSTNLLGTMHVCQAALKGMLRARQGSRELGLRALMIRC